MVVTGDVEGLRTNNGRSFTEKVNSEKLKGHGLWWTVAWCGIWRMNSSTVKTEIC